MTDFNYNWHHNVSLMPYREKGIFPSEGYLLALLHTLTKGEFIIESGVKNGGSTEIWLRALRCPVYSIDHAPIKKYVLDRLQFIAGEFFSSFTFIPADAFDAIIYLDDKKTFNRSGTLFIDGPKNQEAIDLANHAVENCTETKFNLIAIHDYQDDLSKIEGYHRIVKSRDIYTKWDNKQIDSCVIPPYIGKYPHGPGIAIWIREDILTQELVDCFNTELGF